MLINLNDLLKPSIIKSKKAESSKPLDIRPPVEKPIGVCVALDKKSFPVDSPTVKVTTEVRTHQDFEIFVLAFLHKYPHYQYLRKHQSSWSNNTPQYILFDNTRRIQVAFTKSEIQSKLKLKG